MKYAIFTLTALLFPVISYANKGTLNETGISHGMWGDMMGSSVWGWAAILLHLVWLIAGILLIVWLWQQLTKKK